MSKDSEGGIARLCANDCTEEEAQRIYSAIADNYDTPDTQKSVPAPDEYNWIRVVAMMATKVHQILEDKNLRILDIGAGTGYLGTKLSEHGFTNIDAMDMNPDLLKVLEGKHIYTKIMCARLGDKLHIPDASYDVVVGSGMFLPGHAGPDCFPELIRILKPDAFEGDVIWWKPVHGLPNSA